MQLTTAQVAELLGVSKNTVVRLAAAGKLTPVNTRQPGAKKFFAKFDSPAVYAYRRTLRGTNGDGGGSITLDRRPITPTDVVPPTDSAHAEDPRPPIVTAAASPILPADTPLGVLTRLTRIETQLVEIATSVQTLLKVWS